MSRVVRVMAIVALCTACRRDGPTPALARRDNPNVPPACREARQTPRDPGGIPIGVPAPAAIATAAATVRVLSTSPLRVEAIGDLEGLSWEVPLEPTPAAVAKLAGLRFRDVITIHHAVEPVMNRIERDPLPVLDVERSASAVAPVLVEWLPADGDALRVYADGRADIRRPDERVTITLADAELRALLASFAAAGFDAEPGDDHALGFGDVVLACERRQRVHVAGRERALAPVLAALADLRARAAALESPVLLVRGPDRVQIVDWPASAPPLADLARRHELAEAQARGGDYGSPIWQPLPRELMAAITRTRNEHAPVTQVLLRDHGVLHWLYDLGCQYGNPICRPDTYATVGLDLPIITPAPAWAPDFAAVGADGQFFDGTREPRWLTLHGWYLQGDAMYEVSLKRLRRPKA